MEALRHISDGATTPRVPHRLGHRVDFFSRNPHGSLNGPKQPGKNGEKRCLAGTGCAGDKPAFIAIHAQIRNLQYRGRRIAVHKVFNDQHRDSPGTELQRRLVSGASYPRALPSTADGADYWLEGNAVV